MTVVIAAEQNAALSVIKQNTVLITEIVRLITSIKPASTSKLKKSSCGSMLGSVLCFPIINSFFNNFPPFFMPSPNSRT